MPLPEEEVVLRQQVIKSALGNAEDKGARHLEELVVSEARIDGGPMMKRMHSSLASSHRATQLSCCAAPSTSEQRVRDSKLSC